MQNTAQLSLDSHTAGETYPAKLPPDSSAYPAVRPREWFVAMLVDELAVPLSHGFTDAADALMALRQVRARHPTAFVRSTAPRAAALLQETEHG